MLLQGGYRQKRRNRHVILIDIPIGENDNIRPIPVCPVDLQEQSVNRFFQGCVLIIGDRNDFRLETRPLHVFDLH